MLPPLQGQLHMLSSTSRTIKTTSQAHCSTKNRAARKLPGMVVEASCSVIHIHLQYSIRQRSLLPFDKRLLCDDYALTTAMGTGHLPYSGGPTRLVSFAWQGSNLRHTPSARSISALLCH